MNIRYDLFLKVALIYLSLPVAIFFLFFLKSLWAILFTVALILAVFLASKDTNRIDYSLFVDKSKSVPINKWLVIFMVVFSILWAAISGIGEFAWTTGDHTVRAAVLNDLVNYKWPVVYDMSTQLNPLVRAALPDGNATFAYYFTFWLVPAGLGKLFGVFVARIILVIWAAIGLFLTMLGIAIMQKKASWTAPLFFFLFSGLDIIPFLVETELFHIDTTWEGWNNELWIHGNFYQTMNTFHQCIPGWLVTVLLIDTRNNKHIGTIGSLMFCYSPWATIGVLPIAIYELLAKKWSTGNSRKGLRNILSVGNIMMPIIIMAVFALFYTANSNATSIKGFIWTFIDSPKELILIYLGYLLVEFGVWSLLILKDNINNPLYWVSLITLIVFPVYKMSEANDLLMRGTLAPMFVIFILSLEKLDKVIERFKGRGKNNDFKALGVFGIVFAMAMTPFFFLTTEIGATKQILSGEDTSIQPKDKIVSFGNIVDEEFTEVTKRQFFVFEYENQIFYKVFGKS